MSRDTNSHYDVFISYRRDKYYAAELLNKELNSSGFSVFMDTHTDAPGDFPPRIESGLKSSESFILLLTDGALDRCSEPGDWVTREIMLALKYEKRIIPVVTSPPFVFPKNLPEQLNCIKNLQQVEMNSTYYQASIEKLLSFLPDFGKKKAEKAKTPVVKTASDIDIRNEEEAETPVDAAAKREKNYTFLISGIALLCLLVYISLFFVGRYVAGNEFGKTSQERLLTKLVSAMTPQVVNEDELFFVCVNEKNKDEALLFDYKNAVFLLETKNGSHFSEIFSRKEAFVGSAILVYPGFWHFFINTAKHLKYAKNAKSWRGLLLMGAVAVVEGSYFYGKYTIACSYSDFFDSATCDILNEKDVAQTVKQKLLKRWKLRDFNMICVFDHTGAVSCLFDTDGRMLDSRYAVYAVEKESNAVGKIHREDMIFRWDDSDLFTIAPQKVLAVFSEAVKRSADRQKKVCVYCPHDKKVHQYTFPAGKVGIKGFLMPVNEEEKQKILSSIKDFRESEEKK